MCKISKFDKSGAVMNDIDIRSVREIRGFNRFYTNILGLLEKHVLGSGFPLPEIRVLFEIGSSERCTSRILTEALNIDSGYLSRIIKRLEKLGLIKKTISEEDGRLRILCLTEEGKLVLDRLNKASDESIANILDKLSDEERNELAECMKTIRGLLSGEKEQLTAAIRTDLRPGDAGSLISLHGWLYAAECGYNHEFEGYVSKTFYELLCECSPDKVRFWIAESHGEIVGSIAVVRRTEDRAQLRYFLVRPDHRGIGLGKKLFELALNFCRDRRYKSVYLETTDDQTTAIAMYTAAGFALSDEREAVEWGVRHMGRTYELCLDQAE